MLYPGLVIRLLCLKGVVAMRIHGNQLVPEELGAPIQLFFYEPGLGIVQAEEILRGRFGFSQVRVRCHGDIARIEVKPQEIHRFFKRRVAAEIARSLQGLRFKYVTVDLRGYRTGSMNEVLKRT